MAVPEKYIARSGSPVLNGDAVVTYPYDTEHRRVERYFTVPRGTPPTNYKALEEEFSTTVLVQRSKQPGDHQWEKVFEAYENLPGPWIYDTRYDDEKGPVQMRRRAVLTDPDNIGNVVAAGGGALETTYVARGTSALVSWQTEESFVLPGPARPTYRLDKYGNLIKTTRQVVPAGTKPGPGGPTILSDVVQEVNEVYALRITEEQTDSTGAALSAGLIVSLPERYDPELRVFIYTDTFMASPDYANPDMDAEWKQPNGARTGYSATSYDPPRYPVAFRKENAEGGNARIEVDYHRKPPARVDYPSVGVRFPAILKFNPNLQVPAQYVGDHPPPWDIGEDQPGGYRYEGARQLTKQAQRITTYTVGPGVLPAEFTVISPGAASRVFRMIGENTIHSAIRWYDHFTNAPDQLVEDIPASTPSTYSKAQIIIQSATESVLAGVFRRQTVVRVSEALPLSQFPNPATEGFYTVGRDFGLTADVDFISREVGGKVLYALTRNPDGSAGTETANLLADGNTDDGADTEVLAAGPTATPGSTLFNTLRSSSLESPITDDVLLYAAVDPDNAVVTMVTKPTNGATFSVGKTGMEVEYTYVNTLTGSDPYSILIDVNVAQTVNNTIAAIRGTSYKGIAFSAGTDPHPDLVPSHTSNVRQFALSSNDPTVNDASQWSFAASSGYLVISEWTAGESSPPLAIIPAGKRTVFNAHTLTNPTLLDAAAANDDSAVNTLPAISPLKTDLLQAKEGRNITIRYNNRSARPLRVWILRTNFVATTLTTTVGSATFSPAISNGAAGDILLIDLGDPEPTRFFLASDHEFTVPWPMGQPTNPQAVGFGKKLQTSASGNQRSITFLPLPNGQAQLWLEQDSPLTAKAVVARAEWVVNPDD